MINQSFFPVSYFNFTIPVRVRQAWQTCYVYRPLLVPLSNPVAHGSSHLKAKATTVEAALVHGRVFADKALTETTLIMEKKVAVAVVM